MSKVSSLLERAELFEKLATAAPQSLMTQLNSQKNLILAEIRDGINIINMLVATNKTAAQSKGIQALDDFFGQLVPSVQSLNAQSTSESVNELLNQLSNLSFYTRANNAGTGYDPATHLGGARSPAVILDKIIGHVKTVAAILNNTKNSQLSTS